MSEAPTVRRRPLLVRFLALPAALAASVLAVACGGGGGGDSGGGEGNLVLLTFQQDGDDNVPLNRVLEFIFNDEVKAGTVGPASIQIREGGAFGLTVPGSYSVTGSRVLFRPQLPTVCDFSDAGFKPGTSYRVTLAGYPEAFALQSTGAKPLDHTYSFTFTTLPEGDPGLFEDQIPGTLPRVLSSTPGEVVGDLGANAAVPVRPPGGGPAILVLRMSENLNPCSVSPQTVVFRQFEVGDPNLGAAVVAPNGNLSGFNPAIDSDVDPTTWGAVNSTTEVPPRVVPADIHLVQSFDVTEIHVEPLFGEFPDNALLVVELSSEIVDFAGQPLVPAVYTFTTENRPPQTACYAMEFEGETPMDTGGTSADVNTARAPGRAQGFLLFSGDGDNGTNLLQPSLPGTPASLCTIDRQVNDGTKDDFDPAGDVLLDTGTSANTCPNSDDGSRAVVWEFKSFRIRNGVTVRLVGRNPAIVLVQDEILIENGGRLLARGDNAGGAPQGRGGNGTATTLTGTAGGKGVAGGGNGGDGQQPTGSSAARYGNPGFQGYYHTNSGALGGDIGAAPGTGGGHGNTSAIWTSQTNPNNANTPSGGGGGHATDGVAGTALKLAPAGPTVFDLTPDGAGGLAYGATDDRLPKAEAGSGGGAAGEIRSQYGQPGVGPGGAGGAGGGFIDLTAGGNIRILGTVDAAGGGGGNGATQPFNPNYSWQPGSGGGGGGSGGGIRLLTPKDIILGAGSVVTAGGGNGGAGGDSQAGGPPLNKGGNGAPGRLVMEDGDSVITNIASAVVIPSEGAPGFFRGVFDATRFQGGGLTPQAQTEIFYAGPFYPAYVNPVASDFVAEINALASRGLNATSILIEAQAYPALATGEPDLGGPSGWWTVGHFRDSGVVDQPAWYAAANPPDVPVSPDNVGIGIANLSGLPWIQVRITFFLPPTLKPLEPGPFIDLYNLCFTYDQ